ncbi:D-alanyl-D-alanine carboxypeptidase/D-alanyl-D-alanine-endopeptidase [Rhodobaculum claviforme]|uniref:D-alanyl-D-alanine carboxypeptidase/D-alanyl-D-alanine-endopeptidase n=2 Tax=Rhodobaculum claviforme TaxID=1549854 RepID=A0A934WIX4_9RHOB|nr:D-alanyl-D-alanine carboxypeptidase/D-alanyl-D-alanine-endopeptidase [Rhodobaculum claviforme]MBK5927317.1 D-alanyl-D-alanine carboxypeptidase/D-alanyl-D-alanine-endopeptidase [Rhodobaculum claviforme]
MVGALMAGAALPACANAPARAPLPPLRPERMADGTVVARAQSLIDAAGISGRVGYAVADARTGRLLEAAEPNLALPPASVVKALTALYALEAPGRGHRFVTRLVATGPVSGGQVAGDLVLVGGGDPTLDTDDLADLAQALRARGITGITGRFIVNGAALPRIARIDPDQPDHVGYNPAVSGLNLNHNRVQFRWQRSGGGHAAAMDAPATRNTVRVSMAQMQVVARQGPLFTHRDTGAGDAWTVAGPALGNSGTRWLPTRHPELYAGDVLRALARDRGVTLPAPVVANGAPPAGTVVAQHASAPLEEVARDMLRWSNNLTAEAVGLSAVQARGLRPGGLPQSGAQMAGWAQARLGVAGMRLVDHSGLGEASRISPAQMVAALCAPGVAGQLRDVLRDMPLRDANGREIPGNPLQIRAKTGTLNFVSGLAGYIQPPGGPELAFAIFSADLDARRRIPTAQREAPVGARAWSTRARGLQQALLARWGTLHG